MYERFVCVRVTDMRGVDLTRFEFDHDLTFSALVAHPDGTVYHRYGSRDARGADQWLSELSFERFLRAGIERHEQRTGAEPGTEPEPIYVEALPSFQKRDRGACIHCHSVNTSLFEETLPEGPPPGWIWRHPPPSRIGLDLDRDRQTRVTAVAPDSPAAAAGIEVGDELASLGEVPLATAADLMYALHRAPAAATELPVEYSRKGEPRRTTLSLAEGWKVGSALDFAWRPLKWALTPAPGFGGAALTPASKRKLELPPEDFAFQVDYLVTWGDNARYGKAAEAAGIALGDIVVAIDGRRNFRSIDHVHAWWRLEVEFGQKVTIETLRKGRPRTVELTALR